MSALTF